MLVHRKMEQRWKVLPDVVGLESAQQFYDHVSSTPGVPSPINRITLLKGKAGQAKGGFSRVHHYEISGAGRIDYRFHNDYTGGAFGDSHRIVQILTIELGSH